MPRVDGPGVPTRMPDGVDGGFGSNGIWFLLSAMPTSSQAGVYSSVMHYLKAVEALKGKDSQQIMAKMREIPIDDPLFGTGSIRPDGRAVHAMYLYEVKKPSGSGVR